MKISKTTQYILIISALILVAGAGVFLLKGDLFKGYLAIRETSNNVPCPPVGTSPVTSWVPTELTSFNPPSYGATPVISQVPTSPTTPVVSQVPCFRIIDKPLKETKPKIINPLIDPIRNISRPGINTTPAKENTSDQTPQPTGFKSINIRSFIPGVNR